jgi:ferredoxin
MPEDLYRKLARHLDRLPGGFPPTESGVELRILRRLFAEKEAAMALHLTMIPEGVPVISRRAGLSREETGSRLEQMARKGLVFRMQFDGQPPLYTAAQYVIGIWEYHVNDLDPELIRDMNEYIPTLFDHGTWQKAPQLRTIPVERSIDAGLQVLPYEKAEALVRARKKFLVAPCICRREHEMAGKGCNKPQESCLIFGVGADYYERNGIGRVISLEEALEILKKAEKSGLVLQPSNSQKIVNICCCCGCCCQVLKSIKRHPMPARLVSTPFIASSNPEMCTGCGVCVDRCQMDALVMEEARVLLNPDRCIGCGLCISTCPSGALSLTRKPPEAQARVPYNMTEAQLRLARIRGKQGPVDLAIMMLKSKLDRFLASK